MTCESDDRRRGRKASSLAFAPTPVSRIARPARPLLIWIWTLGSMGAQDVLPAPEETPTLIDPDTVIVLTFTHNLGVAAARYDIEAAQFQFQRFERNLSQFIPFLLEMDVEREAESFNRDRRRLRELRDQGSMRVGFSKEFFDGKKIEAGAGARVFAEDGEESGNPFVEAEVEVPLFSSFTTLERITERNFEESEMLEAWLEFIEAMRESISDSQSAYFDLLEARYQRDTALQAIGDLRDVLENPGTRGKPDDLAELEDAIQAYQSVAVASQGELESAMIVLMDAIGLENLPSERIRVMDIFSEDYYGRRYLDLSAEEMIERALRSDVEIRILDIARENAHLKQELARRGKWDVLGRVFGAYDFDRQGDDPSEHGRYFVGVGVTLQRNDPKLLRLTRLQAIAEARKFEAQITNREREVKNRISRRIFQASNLRAVVRELSASRSSRRQVYEQKLEAYLKGEDSVESLINAREALSDTDDDTVEALMNFYEVVVELDETGGYYFEVLRNELELLARSMPQARAGSLLSIEGERPAARAP